jgi:hypothetical protein
MFIVPLITDNLCIFLDPTKIFGVIKLENMRLKNSAVVECYKGLTLSS